jgi:hypothetical protein
MKHEDPAAHWARQRAAGTRSMDLAWKQALAHIEGIVPGYLPRLAPALPAPDTARELARCLAREPDPEAALNSFLDDVAESQEPLEEWLAAFSVLAAHLRDSAHRPTLTRAAGYLHCCISLIESGPRYATFADTARTMLETYGYASDEPSGAAD